jgi:hypothetical protein
MNYKGVSGFILLILLSNSFASSDEAVPLKYSGQQFARGTYGDNTITEYDYLEAYFAVYKDIIIDDGRFNETELNDLVSYYSSAKGMDLSYNLDYKGPASGKTIGNILERAGVKMGRRMGYCYMTMSINMLPCCVDKTLPPGYCYERKTCENGQCVDAGDCTGFVCGDGWCDWEESDPSSACCCEQDCGIPCGGSTTTIPPVTTTSGVTTTTTPSGNCVLPDGSSVPWICGDNICDMIGWPYWYLSENVPFGPCCCEVDCGVACSGGPSTTTTTSVTTTTIPSGSCTFPDGSPVPWVCGDGGCDLIPQPYWYLSENNPFGPCCCEVDCGVQCLNGPTTTTPASTTTTAAVTTTGGATTTIESTTTSEGESTTTTESSSTTTVPGGCRIPWDVLTDVVCGNGNCDIKTDDREGPFSENEPYSPCCCEQDCPGVECKFECVDPTSKQPIVPFTCGDGSCVRTDPGAGFTWMDEDNPNGPCCCEKDCSGVKCGVSTTTTPVTTTTISTTSSTEASTTTESPTTTHGEPTTTPSTSSSTSTTQSTTTTTIPPNAKCVDVFVSGDPSVKKDITFLGSGYARNELALFADKVKEHTDYVFGREPYSTYKDKFNVHYVTKLDAYCTILASRQIDCDEAKIMSAASDCPNEYIIVLVKSDVESGMSVGNAYSVASQIKPVITAHELSHAMGLADEYSYGSNCNPCRNLENCDTDSACSSWSGLAGTTCVRNCTYNNMYRSNQDACIMRGHECNNCNEFCPVCKRYLTSVFSKF